MFDKRKLIKALITESSALPEAEPAAIFMAGLPGSGKTEISRNLIEESGVNLFRIDMDEIAEKLPGYNPEQADEFRKPATAILSECLSYALHHKISFLLDGTFGSPQAIKNIERSLKHGFRIKIVYALQDPKLAWDYTVAREKIEHRAIKFDGFIESYYKTITNLKKVLEEMRKNVVMDIAVKNPDNKVGKWLRDVELKQFDEIVKMEYNKDKLIRYIKGAKHGTEAG